MIDYIQELLKYPFLKNTIIVSLLASIACGITGIFVIKKKLTFVGGGLAHGIFGGIGIAYYLKLNISIGAIIFAFFFAIIITLAKIKAKQQEDTLIGALWAIGMSIGIIFMKLTPGYNQDLMSFIFGNILMISSQDIYIMLFLNLFIISIVLIMYYHFMYVSFDEYYLEVRGLRVNLIYFLLLALISVTVVILTKIVGIILMIAMLTLPAVISSHFTKNLFKMMIIAIVLGIIFNWSGIYLAYEFNLPTGPCIIILAGLVYVLLVSKTLIKKLL